MQITLVGKNILYKLSLPKTVQGNYWLTDGNENDEIYEFQTAKVCEPEKYVQHIKEKIEELKEQQKVKADAIPVLPDKVTFDNIKDELKSISQVPIGITERKLKVYTYDFKKNFATMITSKNMEDAIQYAANILEELKKIKNINIVVFDAERTFLTKKEDLKEKYDEFINNLNENNKKHTVCVIIGIDKFLSYYGNVGTNFNSVIKQAEEKGIYSFIFVENANKFKTHEFEEWYKDYITKENGIWVGNGIDNQYLININSRRKDLVNNCGRSFGYVIKDGIAILLKLLEMKENGDDDE